MKLFRKEKLAALLFLSVSALLSASDSPRAEAEPATDEPARPLFRVCVMDFVQADIVGQRRFLDQESRPIAIPPQCTLNQADRMSIHSVMQGFVRMIDARDAARTNEANRWRMADDNRWVPAASRYSYIPYCSQFLDYSRKHLIPSDPPF